MSMFSVQFKENGCFYGAMKYATLTQAEAALPNMVATNEEWRIVNTATGKTVISGVGSPVQPEPEPTVETVQTAETAETSEAVEILDVVIPQEVRDMIAQGALVVCNHSAGKDSQAMDILLSQIVPPSQLVRIHAHLPEVEWSGSVEHIRATIGSAELFVVQAVKTFLDMVRHRQMFPSPEYRQCTSDLKRGPIDKEIKRIMKERGFTTVINCMGLRAEESSNRAKKTAFKRVTDKCVNRSFKKNGDIRHAGREWYDWLPIHSVKTWQVFAAIEAAGQAPHWVYAEGMTRKSCCFCIMASEGDLRTAARLAPDLYETYVRLERDIGRSMLMPAKGKSKFLEDVVGIPVPHVSRETPIAA